MESGTMEKNVPPSFHEQDTDRTPTAQTPETRQVKQLVNTLARINALLTYAHITLCVRFREQFLGVEEVLPGKTAGYYRAICYARDGVKLCVDIPYTEPLYLYLGKEGDL